ncbi:MULTISPECIES: NAD(P)-dependent oxidoreductase [Brevibacillus]|nr:NAD(P)-dependent oxidoreductase [Brevibacillus borstelensis]MCC0565187.1 NAD(P)-dependent oxidoreductase [Brevibacillus borstelensis]MED1743396.1 NAD(P)-dependent oxidoreductase [Brevibacillus borstelensis]MED1853096.1 NAD(P)-dependent oxidoreductase [Brevibacillus borstelensis]MED1873606.1 NAD(P)-dependent oxidoreductase [Brevibacillus borstelensis]MED1883482.1 NAD(P)-dependent oxidoreductase [Brevibacillus borstelensis]
MEHRSRERRNEMTAHTAGKMIGFVGIGVMGKSMAAHLMKAGYEVLVYNRTKQKAEELLAQGAVWKDQISELAAEADVIITMVGYPKDVEEVYLGEKGIVAHAKPGSYLIDMTTSKPSLAQKIYEEAKKRSLHSLDAPVSGGDVGAREARLTIMVGGDSEAFAAMEPIFKLMGTNVILQGGPGAGQHTKMSNQIAIASNMIGVCEAIAYAKKAGLDPVNVLKSIEAGAAGSWSLSNLAPRMIAGNFAPGFYIKHIIKDISIALEAAKEMGLATPGLELSLSLYQELAEQGLEDNGTQALIKWYDKHFGENG